MAQATDEPTTTRRSALAAIGTASAMVVPLRARAAVKSAPPHEPSLKLTETARSSCDPIFKAIARHTIAEDELQRIAEAADCDLGPVAWRRMSAAVDQASIALIETVPTTADGLAALLWYVHQNQERGLSLAKDDLLDLIRRRASAALDAAAAV